MTNISEVIEATKKDHDAELDRLRGGQLHLSQLRKRIQEELFALRQEEPMTRRELTRYEFQAAQVRASDVGKALNGARQRLNAHTAKFNRDIQLDDVREWSFELNRLQMEVSAFADLWKMAENYVEFCRLQAEQATQEPDQHRIRILQRVSTLKAEFEKLNWNAPQTKRGEEILTELRELQKELNPAIAD